jgi:hypothetical protein
MINPAGLAATHFLWGGSVPQQVLFGDDVDRAQLRSAPMTPFEPMKDAPLGCGIPGFVR